MGMREEFEVWASTEFYSGLADIADTWCDKRGTYNDFAHHMAWCAWQASNHSSERKHAASQIVPAKCSPDCTHKVSDWPGVCMSAFCAMKYDMDEERIDRISASHGDGEHYEFLQNQKLEGI